MDLKLLVLTRSHVVLADLDLDLKLVDVDFLDLAVAGLVTSLDTPEDCLKDTADWILENLFLGLCCMICQFWIFGGQCKSVAETQKLLYIFGSKVAL